MAIERKYERDIDLLLAEEFAVSPHFADWFLKQTAKFVGVEANVLDVYVSRSDSTGESDLVVVFDKCAGDSRFALLIEDKIDAPLQPEQEARYRLRASAEVLRGDYSDYEVVLCSPEAYPATHPGASAFDSFVTYEAIENFLRSCEPDDVRTIYRANFLATAAKRTANSWTRVDDAVTNTFWERAYDIAIREFPDLEMQPLELTKDSTWINIRPHDMPTRPRRIYISLKGDRGFIDLTFTGSKVHLFAPLVQPLLGDDMTVHQTGKSAAIRIRVEGFRVSEPTDAVLEKVRNAFSASTRLVRFYRQHRETLDGAASESVSPQLLGVSVDTDNSSTMPREVVLEVGSEGGSLTLLRERNPHGRWQFWVERNEAALYDLLSEEDRSEIGEHPSQTGRVHSFKEALIVLDRYPWFHLYPVNVHPEFADAVMREVRKRGGAGEETRWREVLKRS